LISGYLLSGLTAAFFLYGPEVIRFVPRCMAGCLLIHVGIDLFQEGLVDSYRNSDAIEYASLVTIAAVMTLYGMTAGLGAGVVLAALTFTLQTSRHVSPIRGVMRATTLRSSAWRSPTVSHLLTETSTHIAVMQLHGHLFFANATLLKEEIDRILQEDRANNRIVATQKIWVLLLDFTLVLGIDSSAVDTIISISKTCSNCGVKVCFSRASQQGFPCEMPLSDMLENDSQRSCERRRRSSSNFEEPRIGVVVVDSNAMLQVADSLEQGLRWCENQVVIAACPELNPIDPYLNREYVREFPHYLHEIYLMHDNSIEITKLLSHFSVHVAKNNCVLWKQGDVSSFAILLMEGSLLSILENEAGTVETVQVGALVGEYGLINGSVRLSTVRAVSNIKYLLLSASSYEKMKLSDTGSVCLLSKLCIGYLGMRVQHVGNRIWLVTVFCQIY
jgi:sulfate permease, SulP family